MTDIELMQQALEALEVMRPACFAETTLKEADTSITALRERLADTTHTCSYHCERPECVRAQRDELRRRLARQEPVDSDEKAGAYMDAKLWDFIDMAAAWPKASPDPRTWDHVLVYAPKPAREEQEPVAWISHSENLLSWDKFYDDMTPLYTAPQREWVGLTEEEIGKICDENFIMLGAYAVDFISAIEAKLKEKNT